MAREIQKRIATAIRTRKVTELRELLERHPEELNTKAASKTWLSHAASQDNLEACRLLLFLGAEVNPDGNYRPLSFAMEKARIELIELLLKSGADPNHGRCIIGSLNRDSGKLCVLKLLVDHNVDVNKVFDLAGTETTFTALDWAKDPEIVSYLKSIGAKTSAEVSRAKKA